MAESAAETLKRLKLASIPDLFYPQPLVINIQDKIGFRLENFLVSNMEDQENSVRMNMPGVDIRKPNLDVKLLESIARCFAVMIRANEFTDHFKIESYIDAFIQSNGVWFITAKKHSHKDVTVYVPSTAPTRKLSQISFDVL